MRNIFVIWLHASSCVLIVFYTAASACDGTISSHATRTLSHDRLFNKFLLMRFTLLDIMAKNKIGLSLYNYLYLTKTTKDSLSICLKPSQQEPPNTWLKRCDCNTLQEMSNIQRPSSNMFCSVVYFIASYI